MKAFDLQSLHNGKNHERKRSCSQSMQEVAAELSQKIKVDFGEGENKPGSQLTDLKQNRKTKKEKRDVTFILTPDLECKCPFTIIMKARIAKYLVTFFGVKNANRFKTSLNEA